MNQGNVGLFTVTPPKGYSREKPGVPFTVTTWEASSPSVSVSRKQGTCLNSDTCSPAHLQTKSNVIPPAPPPAPPPPPRTAAAIPSMPASVPECLPHSLTQKQTVITAISYDGVGFHYITKNNIPLPGVTGSGNYIRRAYQWEVRNKT